jgi:hypothetical protein
LASFFCRAPRGYGFDGRQHARQLTIACYASTDVINRYFLFLTLLALGPVVDAQTGESVVSVDDGSKARSIARFAGGRWVSEKWCTAGGSEGTKSRDRVTVTGDLRLMPIRAIAPGSQEWLRLSPTIVEIFVRRERDERLLPDKTSDAPRAVDWIYSSEYSGRPMYYFEASRRVASPGDPDHDTDPPGTLRIGVAGFLHDSGERLTSLGTKSELRWEQDGLPAGPNRPDLTPLSVVARGTQSIWVMKGQSGTSVWFTLYDVSSAGTRTLLTTRGVRC